VSSVGAQARAGARVSPAMVVVLGALSAFGPLSLDLYLPGLPGLAGGLGASASAAQLTLTACLLGLATGQLISGPWSDAVGRRRPLVIGVGAYVAASLACAVAPSVLTLIGLRFIQGLAGAAGIALSRAVVRDLRSGAAAARLFAGLLLVNGLAPILAPILGGQLLRSTDWRGLFAVLAGVGALILAGTLAFVPESHPPALRRAGGLADTLRVFRELLGQRRFVGCTLASGLAFAAMFAYIAGSPFVLQDIYSLSPAQFSAVFAANGLGIIVAGQLSSPLIAGGAASRPRRRPTHRRRRRHRVAGRRDARRNRACRHPAGAVPGRVQHRTRVPQRDRHRTRGPPVHGRQRLRALGPRAIRRRCDQRPPGRRGRQEHRPAYGDRDRHLRPRGRRRLLAARPAADHLTSPACGATQPRPKCQAPAADAQS